MAQQQDMIREAHKVLGPMLKKFDDFCTEHDICYWADGGTLLGAVREKGFIAWDDDVDICIPRKDYNRLIELRHLLPDSMVLECYQDDPKCVRLYARLHHKYSVVKEPRAAREYGLFIDLEPFDNYNPDGSYPKGFYIAKRAYELCGLYRWEVDKKPAKGLKLNLLRLISFLMYIPNRLYQQWHVQIFKHRLPKWTERAAQLDTEYFGHGYETNWNVWMKKDWVFPLQRLEFEGFYINAPAKVDPYLQKYYGPNYMTPEPPEKHHFHFNDIKIFDYKV